jgi:hypothetical protein
MSCMHVGEDGPKHLFIDTVRVKRLMPAIARAESRQSIESMGADAIRPMTRRD